MNEVGVFEKSWEPGLKGSDKDDAMADQVLKGVLESLKEKVYHLYESKKIHNVHYVPGDSLNIGALLCEALLLGASVCMQLGSC